jgi:hypothetical protein
MPRRALPALAGRARRRVLHPGRVERWLAILGHPSGSERDETLGGQARLALERDERDDRVDVLPVCTRLHEWLDGLDGRLEGTLALEQRYTARRVRRADCGRPNTRRSSFFARSSRRLSDEESDRPERLMYRFSIDMADWNFVRPFVRRLRSTDRFRPPAIACGDRLKIPGSRSIAFDVAWTRRTHVSPRARAPRFADTAAMMGSAVSGA